MAPRKQDESGFADRPVRIDPELTEHFRKEESDEAFIAALNAALLPLERSLTLEGLEDIYPTLHVIGVPRSGTTLLTQIIAAGLNIGYVNNLIARFWQTPVCGIHLARQVGADELASTYRSEFGRTKGIAEPHEFGYFWFWWLKFAEMAVPSEAQVASIDWTGLRAKLINMSHAFGKPIVFKNFLVVWHLQRLLELMPQTCFVRIRRDPYENALSLIRYRRSMLGSEEQWASMRPPEYEWLKDEPFWVQVAGQVFYLNKLIDERCLEIGDNKIIHVELNDLRQRPRETLERVAGLLEQNGALVKIAGDIPGTFISSDQSWVEPDLAKKIRTALNRFY